MFSVYILLSQKSGKYYIGHSEDVGRRLMEHNNPNNSSYTSKHQPWELKASFEVGNKRGDAMKVEKYIKSQKSRKFTQQIVENIGNHEFMTKLLLWAKTIKR